MPLKQQYRDATIKRIKAFARGEAFDQTILDQDFDKCVAEEPGIFFDEGVFGEFHGTPAFELILKELTIAINLLSIRSRSQFFISIQKSNPAMLYKVLFGETLENTYWKKLQTIARSSYNIYNAQANDEFSKEGVNPVSLAFEFGNLKLFECLYKIGSIEPLATYWQQAALTENVSIGEYFKRNSKKIKQNTRKKFDEIYSASKKAAKHDSDGMRLLGSCLKDNPHLLSDYFEDCGRNQYYSYGDFTVKNTGLGYTTCYRSVLHSGIEAVFKQNDQQLIKNLFEYTTNSYPGYARWLLDRWLKYPNQNYAATSIAWDFVKDNLEWFLSVSSEATREIVISKLLDDIHDRSPNVAMTSEDDKRFSILIKYMSNNPAKYLSRRVGERYDYATIVSATSRESYTLSFIKYLQKNNLFVNPEGNVSADHNAIMLAIKHKKPKIFLNAYKNRNIQPWKSYWKQMSGDPESMHVFLDSVAAVAANDQANSITKQELYDFIKNIITEINEFKAFKSKFFTLNELWEVASKTDFLDILNKRPDLFMDYYDKISTNADFYIEENIYIVPLLSNILIPALSENTLNNNKKFFDHILKEHPEYFKWLFEQLLFNIDNMPASEHAWEYIKSNLDASIAALPDLAAKIIDTFLIEHITRTPGAVITPEEAAFLKSLYIKLLATSDIEQSPNIIGLEYRYLISAVSDEKHVISILTMYDNGLLDLLERPKVIIEDQDNPIMLAIKFNKPEIFLHAYDKKNQEPWSIFWKQISGDYLVMHSFLDEVTTKMVDAGQKVVARVNNIPDTNGSEMHSFVKNLLAENNKEKYKTKFEKFYLEAKGKQKSDLKDLVDCLKHYPEILGGYFISFDTNEFMVDGKSYDKKIVAAALEQVLKAADQEAIENFYSYIFKQNIDYFQQLLFGADEKSVWSPHAWVYTKAHVGEVLKTLPAYADLVVEKMQETNTKLKASSIVPYLDNVQLIVRLFECVEQPSTYEDEIDPEENPIIIAAQKNKLDLIVAVFELRDTHPWNLYWNSIGETSNAVLMYLLKQPLGNNKIDPQTLEQILVFVTDNPKCVKYVDYSMIDSVVAHIRSLRGAAPSHTLTNNLSNLLKILIPDLRDPKFFINHFPKGIIIETGLDIKNWFMWNLVVQKNGPKISTGDESANDTNFAGKMKNLMTSSENVLATELDRHNLSYENAKISLRYLLLRGYLEQGPLKTEPDHQDWVNLVKACGLDPETISSTISKLSFKEFEEFIKDANNTNKNKVIAGVMAGTASDAESDELRALLDARNPGADTSWKYRVKYSWTCFDPYETTHRNFSHIEVERFVVFASLRATEDIDKLMGPLDKLADLQKLMGRANGHERARIEEAKINGVFDIGLAKFKLKEYLTLEQKNMQSSMVNALAESWMANSGTGSCPTGIYSRVGKGVLNYDHEYSFVKDGGRPEIIKGIIYDLLQTFTEKNLLALVLNKFKKNISNSNLSDDLKRDLAKSLGQITYFVQFKNLLNSLKEQLPKEQLEILRKLLPDPHETEIAKFFDALFTVSKQEWAELFVGAKSVKTFSAVTYLSDERVTIEDLDSKNLNRSHIISEFRKFVTTPKIVDQLAKLRESAELTEADLKNITFYIKVACGDKGDKPNQKGLTALGGRFTNTVSELKEILVPYVKIINSQYSKLDSQLEAILNKPIVQANHSVPTNAAIIAKPPAKKNNLALSLLTRFWSPKKAKPLMTTTKPTNLPALPQTQPIIFTPTEVKVTMGDIASVRSALSKMLYEEYWADADNKLKLERLLKTTVADLKKLDGLEVSPLDVLNYLYLSAADHAVLKEAQSGANNSAIIDANVTLAEFCILMNSGVVNIDTIADKINSEFLKKICSSKEDLQALHAAVKDTATDPLAFVKYLAAKLEKLTGKPSAQITSISKLIEALNQQFLPQEIEEVARDTKIKIVTAPIKPVILPLEEGEVAPPPPPRPPPPPKKKIDKLTPMGLSVKERMQAFQPDKTTQAQKPPIGKPPQPDPNTPRPRKGSI